METVHCVFFLNPGAYLWKKKINELQELSCDEALIGQMKVSLHDYGSCLVRVAEAALGSHARYAGTTCLASISRNPFHVKSFLRRRVEMFSKHGMLGSTRWIGAVLGTVAVSATVALAFGAEQSFRKINTVNPGTLVVDPAIQVIADKVLAKAIEKEKAKAGFAIVADPNTGRILAVSNIDTVNPRQGHWALSYELEQASFFKSLVAAHAMEQGLTSRQEKHACENGTYLYNGRVYHDWKKGGWDALSTEETILNSSDICSMKIGEKIGPSGLVKMLENFGFGPNGTAQKLPEAKVGELPIAEDPLDLVPFAVSGFGFKSTPVEMLQAYGAIANGGKLMMPQSADQIDSQVVRRVLSAESAREAKEILRQVVLRGTGKPAQSRIYTTAGKTATAWTASYLDWMNGKHGDFAGFIGFAPVDAPRVEIYVGIRDPESHDGAHGSHHAGPVFKELVEEVLQFMNVAPDRPQS
jgi:cell division protein FtsI/penicillin-binding protein 2